MPDQPQTGWTRRDVAGAGAMLALVLGVPLAAVKTSVLSSGEALGAAQRHLLAEVCQLVIPATDTPGAGQVGTGAFVELALAQGLEKSREPLPLTADPRLLAHRRSDGSLNHVSWLEAELNRRAGGSFMAQPPAARIVALTALDAEAYAPDTREHPWRVLKALILTGYYTSEVGGAQELRFELVPGRWDPDLPVGPETRAMSSDWTAVDFG